ncbi:hypothetical protein MLD52_22105, partial [Puniceicoccaceae bacterium K14]|nr:hypothetical protein [Puniceicoccaceae bacterium K14]
MKNKKILPKDLGLSILGIVYLTTLFSNIIFADSLGNSALEIFQETSIGNSVEGNSSYDERSDSFESVVDGSDFDPTKDSLQYIYYTVAGDSSIEVQVSSLLDENQVSFAGVMYRESLAADSLMASSLTSRSLGAAAVYRTLKGHDREIVSLNGYNAPVYVRLVRKGDIFSSYVSLDGAGWKLISSQQILMSDQVYVGFVLSPDGRSSASYNDFQIFPLDFVDDTVVEQGADFVDQEIPSFMFASSLNRVRITMKNTGERPWSRTEGYSLSYMGEGPNPWSIDEITLSPVPVVEEGEAYIFDFDLKAPDETGVYTLEFSMFDGVTTFGEASEKKYVSVTEPLFSSIATSEVLSTSNPSPYPLELSLEDGGARSNGLSGPNYEQYRIGGGNVGYDEAFVMPFKLPAKGASEAVLAGEFSANIVSFGPSLVSQINVYGLAYRSSPNVLQSDFYQGAFVEDMSSV